MSVHKGWDANVAVKPRTLPQKKCCFFYSVPEYDVVDEVRVPAVDCFVQGLGTLS